MTLSNLELQMYDDTSEQFKSAWQNWTRADCVYSQVYAKMLVSLSPRTI